MFSLNPSPSIHLKADHNQPASETPFKWRFAGGLIVVRDCMLNGTAKFKTLALPVSERNDAVDVL